MHRSHALISSFLVIRLTNVYYTVLLEACKEAIEGINFHLCMCYFLKSISNKWKVHFISLVVFLNLNFICTEFAFSKL